jgi:hypothetical protein
LSALFRSHGEGLAGVLDHLAHFTHALGALSGALVLGEDLTWAAGPGLDGPGDIALAKTVAVADVHGRTDSNGD